jgi:Cellulase (glycosyl hydrolase family 5)
VLAATLGAGFTGAGPTSRPLESAVAPLDHSDRLVFERIRAAGATKVRISISWRSIAPKKPQLNAADPDDPAYRWSDVDRDVRLAVAAGLEPILTLYSTPAWAAERAGTPGTEAPDPDAFGTFAAAAATRYGGGFDDLPRVRYWQAWNEPNLPLFFQPQLEDGKPFSPDWYRRMVNAFSAAVKGVHADNVVIAGGTAPVAGSAELNAVHWGPLAFMRDFLCLDDELRPTCDDRVRFDVWAHHPYTSGGPTTKASLPNNAFIADLPAMRNILLAGYRAGHTSASALPAFWVTEFSWDSAPPDPGGVPTRLETRWVAEAMYRMWTSGVTLVTWFSLQDRALGTSPFQSGLYYWSEDLAAARPKPALQAFRFPFVAFPTRTSVVVWGRTPAGRQATVVVEQSFRGGWRRLGVVKSDRYGIIQRSFTGARTGFVRARTLDRGQQAPPFSLASVPDRFVNPFGSE